MTPPARCEPTGSNRDGPEILVTGGAEDELHAIAAGLIRHEPTWYERAGHIVTARRDPFAGVGIADVPFARFHTRLSGLARWLAPKMTKEGVELRDCACPKTVSESVYSSGPWPGLRYLVGVRDTPILRPDGFLVQEPGYDPVTRSIYWPESGFPRIHHEITHDQAATEYRRLSDLFRDFVYEDPGMVAIPVSAILSILGREAIEGALPAHLFSAPQPGTGKSLQLEVISQVGLGQRMTPFHLPMPEASERGVSDLEEEQEKRLTGAAKDGARALFLDNRRNGSVFGGPIIDKYVSSSGRVKGRVLGQTGNPEYPWYALICASMNNAHVVDDTCRRVVEAVVMPTCSRPEARDQRRFKYALSSGFALQHRSEIVASALTIMVGHACAGRPTYGRPDMASFEAWQRIVADAIVWAGGPDPSMFVLSADERMSGEDALAACLMRVLGRLGAFPGGSAHDGVKTSVIVEAVWTSEWLESIKTNAVPPGEHQAMSDARDSWTEAWRLPRNKRPSPKAAGIKFADLCGRVLAGKDVWPADDSSGLQRGEWRIVNVTDRNKCSLFALSTPRGVR